jgi:predicted nucleotidyltransferase
VEASGLTRLGQALARLAADLGDLGAGWALVGGLAVSARSEPRFTRDVDVAVRVASDAEAERLVRELVARGYRLLLALEQAAVGRLATVRLAPPLEGESLIVVDLLFASSGIESEIVGEATPLELFPDLTVPVAGASHLVALKVLSRDDDRRPQDRADLRALLRELGDDELDRARDALRLVRERGFHRGRDLHGDLAAIVERTRAG